jgi:hypothetical protein
MARDGHIVKSVVAVPAMRCRSQTEWAAVVLGDARQRARAKQVVRIDVDVHWQGA